MKRQSPTPSPNAGIAFKKDFSDLTLDEWRDTLSVDLDGVFYCARAALPHLILSKGSIIHTASVSGLGGDRAMTAYNAAKGGVVNFTRALALAILRTALLGRTSELWLFDGKLLRC